MHRKIYLATDNVGVLHLKKWKPVNQRQKRLISYLQQFNITVKYIKGQQNTAADCLSRVFGDMSDQTKLEFSTQPSESDDFLIAVHNGDSENNIAQTAAPEMLRENQQQQQRKDAEVSVRSSACSENIAAVEASTAGNHETMQYVLNNQPTAAIATAITRAQAKAEVVSQARGESAQPEQLSMHTPID